MLLNFVGTIENTLAVIRDDMDSRTRAKVSFLAGTWLACVECWLVVLFMNTGSVKKTFAREELWKS